MAEIKYFEMIKSLHFVVEVWIITIDSSSRLFTFASCNQFDKYGGLEFWEVATSSGPQRQFDQSLKIECSFGQKFNPKCVQFVYKNLIQTTKRLNRLLPVQNCWWESIQRVIEGLKLGLRGRKVTLVPHWFIYGPTDKTRLWSILRFRAMVAITSTSLFCCLGQL